MGVRCVSVTDHWAQFAIAGPRAAEVVATICDAPDLPFMGCAPVDVMGVSGRLFRISFSGELGFEIAVPSRFGPALWRLLVAQAETLGGAAYGMEALNVLRIEKGFLTHAELHGRTTAFDVGLEAMLKDDDFIGRAAATRPGLLDPDRERLVGLKPVGAVKELSAGGFLFEAEAPRTRDHAIGYTTSVGFSPQAGTFIGLGFLKGGPDRHGERIAFVDHLRGLNAVVEVGQPCFYDPAGERMRA
jgi:sarcosine oxidase subunit alpha